MTLVPFQTAADAKAAVEPIRAHLAAGGLLAYPTETVYGLGSRAAADDVRALAQLKGRPPGKPFLLLIGRQTMADEAGLLFNDAARALAEAFWPGPLTLILPGGTTLPASLRGPEGGVAVRWTSHGRLAWLIRELREPITSTSANRPGGPTAPGPEGIVATFGDAVAAGRLVVLDGGVLGNVPPSTLIDCTSPVPRLVREGALPRSELQARVGSFAP